MTKPKKNSAIVKTTTPPKKKTQAKNSELSRKSSHIVACPIVGIGSSAGGLEALTKFLDAMPHDSGLAFVIVQHLDPERKSLMAELLSTHTKMPVSLVQEDLTVEPNHVYIIAPKTFLTLQNDQLHPQGPVKEQPVRLPIDRFFSSLAQQQGQKSICIIMSGTGSDGTLGAQKIKAAGGLVLVEDPDEAGQSGMPLSAIRAGVADYVLSATEMPKSIERYVAQPYFMNGDDPKVLGQKARPILPQIIDFLKNSTTHNFEHYKEGTLLRRIDRRMSLNHTNKPTDYLKFLKTSPDEVNLLTQDFLISVTGFFRDSEVFNNIEKNIIPRLILQRPIDEPIRMWISGCATGEEAYSIGMLALEYISDKDPSRKIQIFASDIDENALIIARNGTYPESIQEHVSKDRLERYFVKDDGYYRVIPELRELIVFANQNLLSDAPFSKLDLISCRNVMIYLTPEVQDSLIAMFHFALRDNGILLLGTSESISANNKDLFKTVSKKHRIFERKAHTRRKPFKLPVVGARQLRDPSGLKLASGPKLFPLSEITQRALIKHHTPAAILINVKSEGLYFSGPVDQYVKVPSGEVSFDILSMVRNGLRAQLRAVIKSAIKTSKPASSEGAQIVRNGKRCPVLITARPIENEPESYYLITFSDQPLIKMTTKKTTEVSPKESEIINNLESELEGVRHELKDTIVEFERTTEDLRAANEEAMSMNEEFQSTNEELETSKEELQSLNEELTTLNNQLQEKIEEQQRTANDLDNLLVSTDIATIILDTDMNIKRFTDPVRRIFNLRTSDIGRPFSDITHKIDDPYLHSDAANILKNIHPKDKVVSMDNTHWFNRRVLPYRASGKDIEGVVITLSDISALKNAELAATYAKTYAESIVETIHEPLIVLDQSLRVVSANHAFYDSFNHKQEETVGKPFFELQDGQWNVPKLRKLMEEVIAGKMRIEGFELDHEYLKIGRRILLLNARQIINDKALDEMLLLAIEDVTKVRENEEDLAARDTWLTSIIETVPDAIIATDIHGAITTFNPSAESMFGYKEKEILGKNVSMLMTGEDKASHNKYMETHVKTGVNRVIGKPREVIGRKKDGRKFPINITLNELKYDHTRVFVAVLRDLTLEKQRVEEQRQSQKMEAMGQLTGSVAHDFNNLLTVIMGNLEILQMKDEDKRLSPFVGDAFEATQLGAALTAQLLAFGRRQPVKPAVLNLSTIVDEMKTILKRTLTEEIELKFVLDLKLWSAFADKSLVSNALLNLCLNARDAMLTGGKLVIETENVILDESSAVLRVGAKAGEYVKLAVTDTGSGMTPEVKNRAFEPYFTTKDTGQGSGLGLSTIYGFVKQSGGFVEIESALGKGSVISIFLPRHADSSKKLIKKTREIEKPPQGSETILVVEDDPRVRRFAVARLRELGYTTIEAENGKLALEIINNNQAFDLLFTDVIMPGGMDGTQLVDAAKKVKCDLRVLYTSGYAEDLLELEKSGALLRKPYTGAILAQKIRKALDR